jgi:adenine-specific DNA-methyltransferase
METKKLTEKNIEKIATLFPNVITEMKNENGKLKKGVNFELLKQELSEDVIEGEECYDFTWVGKKAAIVEGNTPIRKTLRPCIEESKNWENTENLYIEGDNLEVLKLLQESYLNSIKMIYIDPPYNTGNDFIYRDNFKIDKYEYEDQIGLYDEDDNIMFKNTDTNGRFHSDWCSMMYPRLKLAQNLLSEDGVIFISIDDNEVDNLKKICNEVFGDQNIIAQCTRIAKRTSNKGTYFKPTKDYVLVYARNLSSISWKFGVETEIDVNEYKYSDENGRYKKNGASLYQPSLDSRPNQRYWIECPDGSLIIPPGTVFPTELKDGALVRPKSNQDKIWRWSVSSYLQKKDRLMFTPASSTCPLIDSNGNPSKWNIYDKVYLTDKEGETLLPEDVIYDYVNSQGTKELIELGINFSFAKPTGLISYLIDLCRYDNEITILDFFSGSATTAQAVMQLNANDRGNRKFIMVQIPEPCDDKSEAYEAGYKTICDIGKERIRRAGEKIKSEIEENNKKIKDSEEPKKVPDIGFRVLKVDSTNMKDVYYSANEYTQEKIADLVSNIKEDRTDFDLLYGVMLDWGLPLSLKHEIKEIDGATVHIVDECSLVVCFEENVSENVIREIAKLQPIRVVFRDSCFEGSPEKINVEEIFKLLAPNTTIKVI